MITQNIFNKKKKTFMDYEPGKVPSKKEWDTQTTTQTEAYKPFVSDTKMVDDNATKKDYDAFLDGFNDPYGEKREQEQLREAQEQKERLANIHANVDNHTWLSQNTTDPFLEGFNKDLTQHNEIKSKREQKEDFLQGIYAGHVMATNPLPVGLSRIAIGRALEEHIKQKHYERDKYNVNLPQNKDEAIEWDWIPEIADCHQNTAPKNEPHIKYVSPDGKHRENIFNHKGDKAITAVEDKPTYNYASPDWPLEHFTLDILPWVRYGNELEDPTTWYGRIGRALKHGR